MTLWHDNPDMQPDPSPWKRRALVIAVSTAVALGVSWWLGIHHAGARPSAQWDMAQLEKNYGAAQAKARAEFFSKAGTLPPAPGSFTPRHVSCCGEADAYEADDYETDADGNLIAILTCNDPADCAYLAEPDPDYTQQPYDDESGTVGKVKRPPGTRIKIAPEFIITPNAPPNFTGHGWVFINNGTSAVICYASAGGI